ncbi:Gldg family protein [Chitinophaga tropicalis]|uniref:ABC transporter permease subunit n=1 Tax=Chitinophaga tropicalis TaxID=2683588 RepID=A0A7K1U4V5_9BACT|nr:DUF4350 domain-containing protein [Chitinophaga tropicalis]MVT09326.1 ABC transporter permease subunit [Chitinophaga tropicalis]
MKITFRIARLELSNLFFSPVAWVVLVIFMVQTGWEYAHLLERMERSQQLGMMGNSVTNYLYSGFAGLFTKMQENLYLYIPLLTMGLISRETGSGSIKLVFSSPVKVSAVVWGKYLAMVFYCMLLITCLLITGIVTSIVLKDAYFSFIASGLLGLFLLICAYAAIGLFMSSLTTYQVVAAISTLALLAGLNYVGKLWQDIDFVRDITYFLSISGRSENFVEGLITSRDIAYFMIVILLFVGLTILKLKSGKESKSTAVKITRYAVFVVCCLLTGYLTSRPGFVYYKDMTGNLNRTLTKSSQEVVAKMKDQLTITAYVNLLDQNFYSFMPEYRNDDKARFDKYIRFKPDITMNYVYYYDSTDNNPDLYQRNKGLSTKELAKRVASSVKMDMDEFLTPAQIRQKIDLSAEGNRSVRLVEYNGKKTFLRMYNDLMRQPDEKEITAALKRLIVQVPKVAFLSGHNERSIKRIADNDYKLSTIEKTFRHALLNQGFEVIEIPAFNGALPDDIAVLVIADPRTPYTVEEVEQVKAFIEKGGNVLIAAEPQRNELTEPILSLLDVHVNKGTILQSSEELSPVLVQTTLSAPGLKLLGNSPVFRQRSTILFAGAGGLSYKTGGVYTVTPLIVSNSANSFRRTAPIDDSLRTATFHAGLEDEHGSFPLAVALTRKHNGREQKIIVSGDADFMSNSELLRSNVQSANFIFTTELFRWFTYGEFPIDTSRPPLKDDQLFIDASGVERLRWLLAVIFPGIIVVAVTVMLIRRKRR